MKYALNLAHDGRVLSVTYEEFAQGESVLVEDIPEDNIVDYIFVEGKFKYDPIPNEKVENAVTQLDRIEAQLVYTAMMTDTLLEVEENV